MIWRMPWPARNVTEYEISGRLRKGMAGLVRSSVSGHSLVPNPAANITALISVSITEIHLFSIAARRSGFLELSIPSVCEAPSPARPWPSAGRTNPTTIGYYFQ